MVLLVLVAYVSDKLSFKIYINNFHAEKCITHLYIIIGRQIFKNIQY